MDPSELSQAQERRSSRKRKAPASFADEQAVDVYERKSKQASYADPVDEDDLSALISDEEGDSDGGEDTDDDVPGVEEDEPPYEPAPDLVPEPADDSDSDTDSVWREELESVDMGDFKGASEPEEVSLSVFSCFWAPFSLPIWMLYTCLVFENLHEFIRVNSRDLRCFLHQMRFHMRKK